MAVITMSVNDWISIPSNPRQRDTDKRAKIARRGHLAKYEKPHRVVFAAAKNGSILCKLDGHTRAKLWELGELDTPPDGKVEVVLFDVDGLDEAKNLYDMLDSQQVSKKPSDIVFGACRELGFRLDSYLLRGCAFATQLKIATTGKKFKGRIYEMVKEWKKELIQLDALALNSAETILISVMLNAIRRDGVEKAGEFFRKLQNNEGIKSSSGYDGVELLARVLEVRRAEGRTAGYDNLIQLCGQAWAAYEMWLAGKQRKNISLPIMDFSKVVQEITPPRKRKV